MKCKWYAEFEGVCINGECPYRGDVCPTSEHMEACKYYEQAEKKLSVEELVEGLRTCGKANLCHGCPAYSISAEKCAAALKEQAADMLEKLAAEKDAQKPERISVEDRPPEKKHEAYLCSLNSCLLSGGQYIDDIRVFYGDGEIGERPGHSLDDAAQTAEGGRAMKTPEEIKKAVSLCILCERCTDCPYCESESETGCMSALCADALAYIEQLESRFEPKNRVLTLEELKVYTGFLWKVYNGFDCEGAPAFVEKGFMYAGNGNVDLRQDISDTYGKNWRCWLRKPTEAERRETPWEGDSRE